MPAARKGRLPQHRGPSNTQLALEGAACFTYRWAESHVVPEPAELTARWHLADKVWCWTKWRPLVGALSASSGGVGAAAGAPNVGAGGGVGVGNHTHHAVTPAATPTRPSPLSGLPSHGVGSVASVGRSHPRCRFSVAYPGGSCRHAPSILVPALLCRRRARCVGSGGPGGRLQCNFATAASWYRFLRQGM